MIAADRPGHRSPSSKLLVVDARGEIVHARRAALVDFLRPGDLVVANDAATLPASLRGRHVPSGGAVEVRLAGRRSLAPDDVRRFAAVVFGAGDYRTRTEDRPLPPPRPTPRLPGVPRAPIPRIPRKMIPRVPTSRTPGLTRRSPAT